LHQDHNIFPSGFTGEGSFHHLETRQVGKSVQLNETRFVLLNPDRLAEMIFNKQSWPCCAASHGNRSMNFLALAHYAMQWRHRMIKNQTFQM